MSLFAAAVIAATAPSQIELTVYNQGFALVKEERELDLRKGEQEVVIEDVAERIEVDSVAIASLNRPGSFSVLEQNYRFDLISPAAILNKAVGQKITFNRVLPNGSKERIVGTLMSAPTAVVSQGGGRSTNTYNGMVISTDDGRIILNPSGEIEVSKIPEGLISKPSLLWLLESKNAGSNKIQLSYLTQGISWTSNYVLTLNRQANLAAIKGWVSLNNQSGATYSNAKLKLLAGDVQRATPPPSGRVMRAAAGAEFAADKGMSEEQFSEYHLYTLGRPTTVANREMKQVSLLESEKIPVTKKLVVDAMRNYRGWRPNEGQVGTGVIKPLVLFEFENDKKSNMGMALPAGKVKVFQPDSSGSLQLVGEDFIDHTPRDEKITLTVGRSFDIRAERKRTHFSWIMAGTKRTGTRQSFEIEVRNRKESAETVHVYERHWGEYEISQNSLSYERPETDTIIFEVKLKPNEVKKITYTVITKF